MFKRHYEPLDEFLQPNKVVVIYGPRRVGKTTLLQNYLAQTNFHYKLDNGDNIITQQILSSQDFNQILAYVEGYELLAIDEAQNISNIGMGLKIIIDQVPEIRVIATGSSSFESAGQVGEPITGRKRTLILYPLANSELSTTFNSFELGEKLNDFLIFGAYPEVLQASTRLEKIEILREIAFSFLLKDLLVFDRVRSSHTLRECGISRDTPILAAPTDIPLSAQLFRSSRMVPQGSIDRVEYIVYVDPAVYHALQTPREYSQVARLIGQLNKTLEERRFILIGPGRWSSSDYLQGVPVTYADIFNTRALIELVVNARGFTSEPSYGTHFFQDLVETQIFPLAINPEEGGDYIHWDFLKSAADQTDWLLHREPSESSRCIKVIQVPVERQGQYLQIVMDGQTGFGYFKEPG
jgi:hypothetical protein